MAGRKRHHARTQFRDKKTGRFGRKTPSPAGFPSSPSTPMPPRRDATPSSNTAGVGRKTPSPSLGAPPGFPSTPQYGPAPTQAGSAPTLPARVAASSSQSTRYPLRSRQQSTTSSPTATPAPELLPVKEEVPAEDPSVLKNKEDNQLEVTYRFKRMSITFKYTNESDDESSLEDLDMKEVRVLRERLRRQLKKLAQQAWTAIENTEKKRKMNK